MTTTIKIVIFDGADEFDFVGPYEVLKHASRLGIDLEVDLVTLEFKEEVIAQHGLRVKPDGVLGGIPDITFISGGGWVNGSSQGIRQEIAKGLLPQKISSLYAAGSMMVGICTGCMALAAAGVLNGKPATTHHGALKDLQATAAEVVKARVVDTGRILTCGGVTSSLDLALWVVERLWGADTADKITDYLEHKRSQDIKIYRNEPVKRIKIGL